MAFPHQIVLQLPEWLTGWLASQPATLAGPEDRMRLAIDLSRRNVEEATGGPFGAAVFERDSGRLVAAAVNIVMASNTSIAHAETLALALAQQHLGSHTLDGDDLPPMELVASSQPCIQCFGNTWWSGVRGLVVGARAEDVEEITGFREGPLPEDWVGSLAYRPAPLEPIAVDRDVLREEARDVLRLYRDTDGPIYNA